MNHDDLWDLVRQIPSGWCATYGDLGRALQHPTTGRMVGRWMVNCPDDIPWWRVVNKRGALPIEKRNPYAAIDQRKRLEDEGVEFNGDFVDLRRFLWEPEG